MSLSDLKAQLLAAGYAGPWDNVATMVAAFDNAACPAQPPPDASVVETCKGWMSVTDLKDQLERAGYAGPWDDVGVLVAAFNNAACPAPPPPDAGDVCWICQDGVLRRAGARSDCEENGDVACAPPAWPGGNGACIGSGMLGRSCAGAEEPPPPVSRVETCKGWMSVTDLKDQLERAGYAGPWDDVGVLVAAFNNAACPAPPPPGPGPIPEPTNNTTTIALASIAAIGLLGMFIASRSGKKKLLYTGVM